MVWGMNTVSFYVFVNNRSSSEKLLIRFITGLGHGKPDRSARID